MTSNGGIELAIRLAVLSLLLYLGFILVRPFITIAVWSVVLTVALYPAYDRTVRLLGGRRRLAAFLLTLVSLFIVIGPAAWLALGLVDSIQHLSERLDLSTLKIPAPTASVKSWPIVGEGIFQFWELAAANLHEAAKRIVPQLRPIASTMLGIAADAGTGAVKFLIALVIAGFLFPPAPAMVDSLRTLSRRLTPDRGEAFVQIVGATIRAVARGVIGISALQAFLVGVGVVVAGVPAATLITSAALILGIVQIGPSVLIIPLIIWSWTAMETTSALLFSAYMIPVSLLDNFLKPLLLGRGLDTPIVVILIGVIGGTISLGITGLFLGPIIMAVLWELLVAWMKESAEGPV